MRPCDVTVETPDGERHTITVEARSLYWAAITFFSLSQAPQPGESLPRVTDDTVFEVRPIYRIGRKELMDWANREAERVAR
jgi:hypothetical protein